PFRRLSMTTLALSHPPRYLTDRFQGTLARDLALVLAGAAVITALALITIPLPFTPVPITLATPGVMGVGASLGPVRGASSAGIDLLRGAVGAPIFSDVQAGVILPPSGYGVGYVLGAFIAAQLARRRADRRPVTPFALAALGTLVLYLCGGAWLAVSLGHD